MIAESLLKQEINCKKTDSYRSLRNDKDKIAKFGEYWEKNRPSMKHDISHLIIHYSTWEASDVAYYPDTCAPGSIAWSQTDYPSTNPHDIENNLPMSHTDNYGVMDYA